MCLLYLVRYMPLFTYSYLYLCRLIIIIIIIHSLSHLAKEQVCFLINNCVESCLLAFPHICSSRSTENSGRVPRKSPKRPVCSVAVALDCTEALEKESLASCKTNRRLPLLFFSVGTIFPFLFCFPAASRISAALAKATTAILFTP